MKKTISILAIAGSISLLGAGAAQAYPAPPAPGNGTIIDNNGGVIIAGDQINFNGGGFAVFGDITINITIIGGEPAAAGAGAGRVAAVRTGVIVLNQVVESSKVKADANGNFSLPVTLNEAGTYQLTATGLAADGVTTRTVSSVVTVAAAATAPVSKGNTGGTSTSTRGGLANTGIDSAMFLWGAAGIGALGLGAGSIVVARRRTGAEA
jgi:LPXTG-motif cell wall-anchored protein